MTPFRGHLSRGLKKPFDLPHPHPHSEVTSEWLMCQPLLLQQDPHKGPVAHSRKSGRSLQAPLIVFLSLAKALDLPLDYLLVGRPILNLHCKQCSDSYRVCPRLKGRPETSCLQSPETPTWPQLGGRTHRPSWGAIPRCLGSFPTNLLIRIPVLRCSSNSHRYRLSPTDRATTSNSRQMEDWLICLFQLSTSKWMGSHPALMGARHVNSLGFLLPLGSGNFLQCLIS